MSRSSKIILNTGILYGKSIISLLIGLFSTRYVLDALGIDNFGIYSLIGGVIAFLSFLNVSFSNSTQRFLSFYREEQNSGKLHMVFNVSILLHLFIGVLLILVLTAGSLFLFNGFLNIDTSRLMAAKFVFFCMIFSAFFTIMSAPYDAYLISMENIKLYALFQLCESVGKFLISVILYHTMFDVLETYGFLMAVLSMSSLLAKKIYCNKKYEDTKLNLSNMYDKNLFNSMFVFSSFTLIELIAKVVKLQGITVLFNIYYGVVANAAYGVTNQIGGNISGYVGSIFKSSSPQVLVHVNKGELDRAIIKTLSTTKLACIVMSIFVIPLIIEMPYVLHLWLKNIPEYAVSFCRITLLTPLIMSMVYGLNALLEGVGTIKAYRLWTTVCHFSAFFIAFIFMIQKFHPVVGMIAILISDFLTLFVAMYYAVRFTPLSGWHFIKEIPLRIFPVTCGAFLLLYSISVIEMSNHFVKLICMSLVSTVLISVFCWIFVLNRNEKYYVKEILKKIFQMISKK
jgi:O-antigen/teichoic acid export membrane protein